MASGGRKAAKSIYVCTACGATSPKWAGQCSECLAWNVMEESVAPAPTGQSSARFSGYAGA
ncbi:MAG: DNA repair protein RadA, partial [Candidatus Thiodiazotropha sp.]